ncbi:LytR/AlgR family response regulator transcription factor [Chitinophaga filiformis]|uniref:Two component transcriptional regulator, LytTR family n=1 Tax=Chitinophaga filiformis TaxID=104663 RepID=A0A1G8CRU4_CHIFI|nr:LytTR family DNA-binding domain-containing protein [Chitinophaga filiformis]SDH47879.1 two component transcriptional regulator, LytTR family [Chitinophaga filiformis]
MSGSLFQEAITTLLVDDEEMAIHRLKKSLSAYPQIKIIGTVGDGPSAVAFINQHRPDLVFLDIQIPAFNGFEVLNQLEHTPLIVFVTAYEEYAIRAFEKNSLDYLLKPVEDERLALTIKRISERREGEGNMLEKIRKLISEREVKDVISTIPVKKGDKIQLVHVGDIVFFEAKEKYVSVHTRDEEKLIEYSLSYLEDRLPPEFLRVHRSFIVNKLNIREIQKYFKGTYILVMNDAKGSKIKSAYSYLDTIKTKLLLP